MDQRERITRTKLSFRWAAVLLALSFPFFLPGAWAADPENPSIASDAATIRNEAVATDAAEEGTPDTRKASTPLRSSTEDVPDDDELTTTGRVQVLRIVDITPRQNPYYSHCIDEIADDIAWGDVEFFAAPDRPTTLARIHGQLPTGAQISFRGPNLYIADKKLRKLRLQENPGSIGVDPSGLIEIQIELSPDDQLIGLPLVLSAPGRDARPFMLKLARTRQNHLRVQAIPQLTDRLRGRLCLKNRIGIAAGLSFFPYDQTGTQANASYVSSQFGGYSVDGRAWFGLHWGLQASYRSAPGLIVSASTAFETQKFRWNVLEADALYRLGQVVSFRRYHLDPYFSLGVQQHDAVLILANRDATFSARPVHLQTTRVGLGVLSTYGNWQYNFELGDEFLSKADGVEVQSPLLLDGGVGVTFVPAHRAWQYGLNWAMHWHQYDYVNPADRTDSGHMKVFFSNVELRLGHLF